MLIFINILLAFIKEKCDKTCVEKQMKLCMYLISILTLKFQNRIHMSPYKYKCAFHLTPNAFFRNNSKYLFVTEIFLLYFEIIC